MFKKFTAILAAMMFAILAIVPVTGACAATTELYVNSGNGLGVRVHTTPGAPGDKIVCTLGVGFPVTAACSADGWTQITFQLNGRKKTGYMMEKYLQTSDPARARQHMKDVQDPFTVTVRRATATGRVNLWPSCSKKGACIRTLANGEKLTVVAYGHAWYMVTDANGQLGYVAKAYVRK